MNVAFGTGPLEAVDAMLIDIARQIQLSPTLHDIAVQHFEALCRYVDRKGSPLAGKVLQCYGSGSFATGTAILSHVKAQRHDVDVVMEVDTSPTTPPRVLLGLLFDAINGEPGSRYHGRVTQNTRCVTVEYDDGTKVDLMPIARLPGEPDRAGHLFHFKRETGHELHKPVNPWAFAQKFNADTEVSVTFAKAFQARAAQSMGIVGKADTEPLPEHVPLSEKSTRVVAIQLTKRARDLSYRRRKDPRRRPPSIVIAALALELSPTQPRLIDEQIALVRHIRLRLMQAYPGKFELRNPVYWPDVFTDRWPEDADAVRTYAGDLRQLEAALYRLRNDALSLDQIKSELEQLFGETAANRALEGYMKDHGRNAGAGSMFFGTAGRILTGAAAMSSSAVAARASTFQGGELPE